MSGGFLSGVIWGGAVAAFGLALASQVAPVRVKPPLAGAPVAQQAPAPDPLMTPQTPAAPALAEAEPAAPVVPEPGTALPDTAAPAMAPATTPAETATVDTDLTPPPGSEFARPLPEVEPVLPGADSALDTEAAPVVPQPEAAPAPAPDTASAARPAPAPLQPEPAPAAEPAEQALAALPGTDAPAAVPDPVQPATPGSEVAPAQADLPPPPPLTEDEQALAQSETPAEPSPTPGFDAPVAGVTTGRLPSIGDAPEAPPLGDASLPPLQRFARPFDNPAAKPLFSVVLIDTGGPDLDRIALARMPFPVSFAIDPLAPDAETAAAIYRAAGQEVLMLATGIPQGATASDLEVTFQSHEAVLPEAVAVLDTARAGFQDDRPLATQVATLIKAQGRGLVTYDRGLNAADQVARREALPAARIFRTLDAEGEASPAIRRYLDRAAFKAAQDGRVTVIGSTRPETVAALLEWSVEGRAASVALAPASAALSVQ